MRKPRRVLTPGGIRFAQVTIGGWHCLAVAENGQAYAWGGNEYGQCGLPLDQRDVRVPTPCVPRLDVTQVAAGGMHSCVLTKSGEVNSLLCHFAHPQHLTVKCRHISEMHSQKFKWWGRERCLLR